MLDKPLSSGDHSLTLRATSPDGTQGLTGQQPVNVAVGKPAGEAVVAQKETAAPEEPSPRKPRLPLPSSRLLRRRPSRKPCRASPSLSFPTRMLRRRSGRSRRSRSARSIIRTPAPTAARSRCPASAIPMGASFFSMTKQPIGQVVVGDDGTWVGRDRKETRVGRTHHSAPTPTTSRRAWWPGAPRSVSDARQRLKRRLRPMSLLRRKICLGSRSQFIPRLRVRPDSLPKNQPPRWRKRRRGRDRNPSRSILMVLLRISMRRLPTPKSLRNRRICRPSRSRSIREQQETAAAEPPPAEPAQPEPAPAEPSQAVTAETPGEAKPAEEPKKAPVVFKSVDYQDTGAEFGQGRALRKRRARRAHFPLYRRDAARRAERRQRRQLDLRGRPETRHRRAQIPCRQHR